MTGPADNTDSVKLAVGERKPLTKARSKWEPQEPIASRLSFLGEQCEHLEVWRRRVGDGFLSVIVTINPSGPEAGWHMSISFMDHRGKLSRYPRWDEIADARYEFIPDDVTMCMVLPPPDEYVALHDSTFHLHEHCAP